jgi:UDPglucose 6-dehydrogenase
MKNIAVIGSGVVGSATGKGFISKGHKVIFYDINSKTIDLLKDQGLDARHVDSLNAKESEIFFLVVPTPTENGKINLSYIEEAAKSFGRKMAGHEGYFMVVVRSTVLPGTTENIIIPAIENESGKKAGSDFGVAMNPEYLREKNADDDFKNPWIISVGTLEDESEKFMKDVFDDFDCPVHYISIREAETQKYVHNLYNAVKIAFFNEMRMACEKIGINPDRIFEITTDSAEGFWNKKYGIMDFGPFDGMCLPKDTQAFSDWAKKSGVNMDVLNGAISSNKRFEFFWNNNKKNI